MSHSTPYTAKDIERYHSGQLSAAEMHALEKAALDDPFLADALEGYAVTHTPTADLASLQQRLQQRIEKNERKNVFFMRGNSWMKIAALFLLFAGGGWLVFRTMSGNSEHDMATNQATKQQAPAPTPTITADSAIPEPSAPNSTRPESSGQEDVVAPSDDIVTLRQSPRTKAASLPPPVASQPMNEERNNDDNRAAEIMSLRRPIDDSSAVASNMAKAKEQEGSYKITVTDSVTNIDVVLKPNNTGVDEVVVLNQKARKAPQRRQNIVVDSLEPREGWNNYDEYLANNLREPEEFKLKPVSGEVELSFDINQKGEPVNITVVKSLCPECDKEAIRLLKQGPKWKNLKKKGKIKIRF